MFRVSPGFGDMKKWSMACAKPDFLVFVVLLLSSANSVQKSTLNIISIRTEKQYDTQCAGRRHYEGPDSVLIFNSHPSRTFPDEVMGALGMVHRLRGGSALPSEEMRSAHFEQEDSEVPVQEVSDDTTEESDGSAQGRGTMNLTALLRVKRSKELRANEFARAHGIDFEETNRQYQQAIKEERLHDDEDYRKQARFRHSPHDYAVLSFISVGSYFDECRCGANSQSQHPTRTWSSSRTLSVAFFPVPCHRLHHPHLKCIAIDYTHVHRHALTPSPHRASQPRRRRY